VGAQSEAEGKLLPSMFIGALAKYEYGSGTPLHSPVSLMGAETQGGNLRFFPIIDNIIKKNKLYNNTFSLICGGIISIVLLLKKRKKGETTRYMYTDVYIHIC